MNLGGHAFFFCTSLHALIKALTSVGHTKEGSYLHTHAKRKNHTSTRVRSHACTFDSIIIEPTSRASGSHERRAHASFDVSLGFWISSNAALFRKEIFRLAKSYRENNLASVNAYYRFAQDSGRDTIFSFISKSPRTACTALQFLIYIH